MKGGTLERALVESPVRLKNARASPAANKPLPCVLDAANSCSTSAADSPSTSTGTRAGEILLAAEALLAESHAGSPIDPPRLRPYSQSTHCKLHMPNPSDRVHNVLCMWKAAVVSGMQLQRTNAFQDTFYFTSARPVVIDHLWQAFWMDAMLSSTLMRGWLHPVDIRCKCVF